jgi:transcriptional regulator with XRE-family HTH domain
MPLNMTHGNNPVKTISPEYSCAALAAIIERRDNAGMENLKRLRTARELSQVQLAEAAGCSQSLVSKLEKGGKNVTLGQIEAIASVLRCEPWELFGIDSLRQRYLDALNRASPDRRNAVLLLLEVEPQEPRG